MHQLDIFNIVTYSFIGLGILIFISLFFVTAPYGRHATKSWGPMISNKTGWFVMEIPASVLFALYFFYSPNRDNAVLIAFFLIWQSHYFYRAFIFPFQQSSSKMPITVAIMGLLFNSINTYIQGTWLYFLSPIYTYTNAWFSDPRFISGIILFYAGYIINRQADAILHELRADTAGGYKIPFGGLYKYISCPNYFGEIIQWVGWAILTWSFAGGAFAIWTFANLAPRAFAHHKWYLKTFPDYPKKRKSLVPFLF